MVLNASGEFDLICVGLAALSGLGVGSPARGWRRSAERAGSPPHQRPSLFDPERLAKAT
jgi:hypothetical protein